MNKQILLAARPAGFPKESDFRLAETPVPSPKDGEFRVKILWLSLDPYMRGRMDDRESYVPPFALDAPLDGGAVGEVVASQADGLAPGDTVVHQLGWREHAVLGGGPAQGRAGPEPRDHECDRRQPIVRVHLAREESGDHGGEQGIADVRPHEEREGRPQHDSKDGHRRYRSDGCLTRRDMPAIVGADPPAAGASLSGAVRRARHPCQRWMVAEISPTTRPLAASCGDCARQRTPRSSTSRATARDFW